MRPEPAALRFCLAILASASLAALAACDDGGNASAVVAVYIDGAPAADPPRIDFAQAIAGKDQATATVELRNLGPGALRLTGTPPAHIEKDDRLAFGVTQPADATIAAGSSVTLTVTFHPRSAGADEGRVVLEAAGRDPLAIDLAGSSVDETAVAPVLGVTIDGAPAGASFDFGAITPREQKAVTVSLANIGTGTLVLPASGAIGVTGEGYTVATPSALELGAGEHTDVDLTFQPAECSTYRGKLTVMSQTPGGDAVEVALVGRGGTNPQGYDALTESLAQPDADVALGDPSGGTRRLAVGNLAFASFAGRVGVYSWDGCSLGAPRTLSPTTTGLAVQLFGAQVAFDDGGDLLLITARDADEAWLFELKSDNTPTRIATLATLKAGKGNGRGAALAGDGAVAFVGESLADSGFNAHGVVLAYPRPTAGWSDFTDARFRLAPSNPTVIQQVGSVIECSGDGRVVVAGAFEPSAGAAGLGPPRVYLWEALGSGADITWGNPLGSGVPETRTETVQLATPGSSADVAAVAVSRDGSTVAMPVSDAGDLRVHLWVRPGASWANLPDANGRAPTATVDLGVGAKTRLAVGADGSYFIAADAQGAREVLRPASGWDASAGIGRRWNVAFFGAIALAPDGQAFAGLDASGRGWLVWR